MDKPLDILYIDNHLIILNKPAGLLVQGDASNEITLIELAKYYLKKTYNKPDQVYLGLVHRLDKPVSGIVVFARTSKAASRLSDQIRQRQFTKIYHAFVEGKVPRDDSYVDYLSRENRKAIISSAQSGKYSRLYFKRLSYRAGISQVEIRLDTGRYHQIRAQFSYRNFPIVGDVKYGARLLSASTGSIALHAHSVTFRHPIRNEILTVSSRMEMHSRERIF